MAMQGIETISTHCAGADAPMPDSQGTDPWVAIAMRASPHAAN